MPRYICERQVTGPEEAKRLMDGPKYQIVNERGDRLVMVVNTPTGHMFVATGEDLPDSCFFLDHACALRWLGIFRERFAAAGIPDVLMLDEVKGD